MSQQIKKFALCAMSDTQLLVMVAVQLNVARNLLSNACLLELMEDANNADQVSL